MNHVAVYPEVLSGFESNAHKQPRKVGLKELVQNLAELVVVQVLGSYPFA
jgi:hypothetical protein